MVNKTKLLLILLVFSIAGCLPQDEDYGVTPTETSDNEGQVLQPGDEGYFNSDQGFPLDEPTELERLEMLNVEKCMSNSDCTLSEIQKIADDFQFKSGQLIFKGSAFVHDPINRSWFPNELIDVITFSSDAGVFNSTVESEYHRYELATRNYSRLIDGLNMNLEKPLKYLIVTQGKLGLQELTAADPRLCDLFAAERFYINSQLPWPKYTAPAVGEVDNFDWAPRTGFDENNDLFTGETLIICGEINLLNRTVKLEAKNIIFYNSHIKVMSDRDMPSGLRIIAENIGFFGANLIESNIMNRVTGQKNASAPTIEIGTTGIVAQLNSSVPANNRFNEHFLKILMAEHIEN